MDRWKCWLLATLVMSYLLAGAGSVAATEGNTAQPEPYMYVALGDVLTKGHMPGEHGMLKSYAHMTAEQLMIDDGMVVPFANAFTHADETAQSLLARLTADEAHPDGYTIMQHVKVASLITISAGFADIFGSFDRERILLTADSEEEKRLVELDRTIRHINRLLLDANPDVRIIWLHYYNTFDDRLTSDHPPQAAASKTALLNRLNATISGAADASGAESVRTTDVIGAYPPLYLTMDSQFMLPSLIGHRAIASRVVQTVRTRVKEDPLHTLTDTKNIEHADGVRFVLASKLMIGYGDRTFRPQKAITRAEAAITLYRALSMQYNRHLPVPSFQDVDQHYYFYRAVHTWTALGVIDDGPTFRPDEPINAGIARKWMERAGLAYPESAAAVSGKVTRGMFASWIHQAMTPELQSSKGGATP